MKHNAVVRLLAVIAAFVSILIIICGIGALHFVAVMHNPLAGLFMLLFFNCLVISVAYALATEGYRRAGDVKRMPWWVRQVKQNGGWQ